MARKISALREFVNDALRSTLKDYALNPNFGFYDPDDPELGSCLGVTHAILFGHHRDSKMDQESNWNAIVAEFSKFSEDNVRIHRFRNPMVGWEESFVIRMFRTTKGGRRVITAAAKRAFEITRRLEDYPLLDEEDYSREEWEAMMQSFRDEVRGVVNPEHLMDEETLRLYNAATDRDDFAAVHVADKVYEWMRDQQENFRSLENIDGDGAYLHEDERNVALQALGFFLEEWVVAHLYADWTIRKVFCLDCVEEDRQDTDESLLDEVLAMDVSEVLGNERVFCSCCKAELDHDTLQWIEFDNSAQIPLPFQETAQ